MKLFAENKEWKYWCTEKKRKKYKNCCLGKMNSTNHEFDSTNEKKKYKDHKIEKRKEAKKERNQQWLWCI